MHFRRWVLALMIALMLIDAWVKSAEAKSIESERATAKAPGLAIGLVGPPQASR
jgi:hypothetical protein